MPYKDPEKERACGRRRYERITAERTASGMCPRCGKARPAPDRALCRHCGEKRRKAERARCAKAKAAGTPYGGRDAERCREFARDRSRRRDRARRDARMCTRCGTHPPVEGGTVCESCHVARRDREREQYAARRAAGLCGRCQRRSKSTPLAGVKMHHLMRFSPALAVVPVVHTAIRKSGSVAMSTRWLSVAAPGSLPDTPVPTTGKIWSSIRSTTCLCWSTRSVPWIRPRR